MKKLKHSKYKNTGILFEMLVRKLTSETLSSNKSVTVDIIKKYFGKNTELAKELYLYNSLLKENFKTEALALEYIRTVKASHSKLNQAVLRRQKYNLVKEISEKFIFTNLAKIQINNYKELASINMLFEYDETDNPKRLLECKNVIIQNGLISSKKPTIKKDELLETFQSQSKDIRLLSYQLLVDKFNTKYSVLSEQQKSLLNKYITNVNDTAALKTYIQKIIPSIKRDLALQAKQITEPVTKIKVAKLSEMLCNVETMKVIKESHVLSLLRYFDLVDELKGVHS
jgi:hypothetical protein